MGHVRVSIEVCKLNRYFIKLQTNNFKIFKKVIDNICNIKKFEILV